MNSKSTQAKIEWLKRIGFAVRSLEDGEGWIATRDGMTLQLRAYDIMINEGFRFDNWTELNHIPFQFIIRGYMQQMLGLMTANEDEKPLDRYTGNGLFNTLS